MNGKGDKQRPCCISREMFADNWNRAFGPKTGESMNRKFSQTEIEIVQNAVNAKGGATAPKRTVAKELLLSNVLPGRTYLSIYSRVRETVANLNVAPTEPAVA